MKAKLYGFVVIVMLLSSAFSALADTPVQSTSIGISFQTEQFVPKVYLNRAGCKVYHNNADGGQDLVERVENYAFFGEKIICDALVVDKNGVPEKLLDVYMTVSESQEPSSDAIEANCDYVGPACHVETDLSLFNARIGEETLDCSNDIMDSIAGIYKCELTIESQTSMYGEYWVSVVAEDLENQIGYGDEQMFWYLNPNIGIDINGEINFGTIRPDTVSYSRALTVSNAADSGSGVLLNMYISGTDFVDPSNSGGRCPTSNVLELKNFGYYASNGAYHTVTGNARENTKGGAEGYYTMPYETGSEIAREEIIEGAGTILLGGKAYPAGNILSPGADMSLTFRLYLPAPCNGDFTDGSIFLWAEAI